MKKVLFLLSAAAMLLAGCAKEALTGSGEGEQTVSISVAIPDVLTKAAADNDGNAKKANRWIFEVRDAQGALFFRKVEYPVAGTTQQTFKVSLIKNQSYNLLFWADNNGGFYNAEDLTNVTLTDASAYIGNLDARDAFTACKAYTATNNESISVELYRPFAQLNVVTTDLETLWAQAQTTSSPAATYLKFEPKNYIAKLAVPTSFNVKTQQCGEASDIVVTASESYFGYQSDKVTPQTNNNYQLHTNPATLFMDYVFASKGQKDIVDISFEFTSNDGKISYAFTSIPMQANYRTNINGKILSYDTEWNVTIEPAWTGKYDVDLFETTINNIAALNDALASNEAAAAKEVTATATMPSDSDDKNVEFTDKNNKQIINLNFEGSLGANKTITFANIASAEGPSSLNIIAPSGTKLVFNNPLTHVVINGTSYDNISGTFSANSLIIPEGVTVKHLDLVAGGLEVHGVLESVTVSGTISTVFVRSSEGLSAEVYNVLKPFIAVGFEGIEVEGKWNIVAGDNWAAYAAAEYTSEDPATKTIVLGSAAQLALLSNKVNSGTTYEGWTIKLASDIDMSAHVFTPIGNFTDNKPFKGTFDGQNYNIKDINVYSINKKGVGVFGKVYAPCVIKNLNVIGANVTAEGTNTYTGGLVGHGYATIQNCTFKGDIHGGNQMGGIAAAGGFAINGCTFEGNIYGKYWGLGGIIGNCQDGDAISNNTAKGSIIGVLDDATNPFVGGGIIGCAIYTSTEVKDNYSAMNITFNGEAQIDYPVMGLYNIDDTTIVKNPALYHMDNLLTSVADNQWDKNIYPESAYTIYYDNVHPQCSYMFMNYGAATTRWPVAVINGVEYSSFDDAISAAKSGDEIDVISPVSTISIPAGISENITIKGNKDITVQHFALASGATYKNLTISDFSGTYPGTDKNFITIPDGTVVENMLITNVSLSSVSAKGNWTTAVRLEGSQSKEIKFEKCDFDGVQYSVYSPSSTGKSLYFDDCDFNNTSSWAIQTNGGGAADSVAVVNCRFDNCKGLVKTNTTTKFVFRNNTITGECRHDNAESKIFGVTVTESIEVADNTRDGIAFAPTSANGLNDNTSN